MNRRTKWFLGGLALAVGAVGTAGAYWKRRNMTAVPGNQKHHRAGTGVDSFLSRSFKSDEGGNSCAGRQRSFFAISERNERGRVAQPRKSMAQNLHRLALYPWPTQSPAARRAIAIPFCRDVRQTMSFRKS